MAGPGAVIDTFDGFTRLLDYLSPADRENVRLAYLFADQAHQKQVRNSGEPYVTHPIAVAAHCAQWKLDAQALMAALLHDVLEDCGTTKDKLIEKFGLPVADLVDGLTKLEKRTDNTREENQAESFRKLLLAMSRDVRVILIKLADRTHNMRTLSGSPRDKWARIATETLDIYVPIAHRLGLNQTYRELQDLSLKFLRPWRYAVLETAISNARSKRINLPGKVISDLESMFSQQGMAVKIASREKTLYSIYHKMGQQNLTFAQVADIYGFRIIVPQQIDCYTALGLLHQFYKPVPGRFKDHIAISKINGYQSLHTALVGPAGVSIEFQIRTEPMHLVAETGVAARWLHRDIDQGDSSRRNQMSSKWLQSLLDIQDETSDATEFWEHVREDLFPDAVYVFTPKSQVMAMPRHATVIDFAYAIHSKLGTHAVSAKINHELVPLRTEIKNGDVIEVITDPDARPNPAWLDFVCTARARSKIRQYLKSLAQTESENLGEKMLTQAVRAQGIENLPGNTPSTHALWDKLLRATGNKTRSDLMSDIGLGKRIARIVARRLVDLLSDIGQKPDALLITRERFRASDNIAQGGVCIDGSENTSVRFATCCRPIPGDSIVGYLGRGEGLTVHVADCTIAKKLQSRDSERFISVEWSEQPVRTFETGIVVTVHNGKGVLARVAGALADADADITHVDLADKPRQGAIDIRFVIDVRDLDQLNAIFNILGRAPAVIKVQRSQNSV